MKGLPVPFQGPMTNQAPCLVPVVVMAREAVVTMVVVPGFFCILDIAGFGGVGGRFPGGALSGGDSYRFGGAAASSVDGMGAPVFGSGSA